MKKEIIDLSVPKKKVAKRKLKPPAVEAAIKESSKKEFPSLAKALKKSMSNTKSALIVKHLKEQRNKKPKLEKVVKEHGGTKAFSEKIGISASTISKLLRTDAPISDRVATAIETITNGKLSVRVLKRMHIKKD